MTPNKLRRGFIQAVPENSPFFNKTNFSQGYSLVWSNKQKNQCLYEKPFKTKMELKQRLKVLNKIKRKALK